MPIYDRSYRRWDGELKKRTLRWLPITRMGIRLAFRVRRTPIRRVVFLLFLAVSFAPFLVLLLMNYAYQFPPENLLPDEVIQFLAGLEPYRVLQYPALVWFCNPLLMIFTVLFGADLIARDKKAQALPLYRSRPLTLTDYLLGKLGVIGFYLSCLSLFPCLFLWLFNVLTSEQERVLWDTLPELGAIFGHTLTLFLVYSMTILAASSFVHRPMVAGILWFGGVLIVTAISMALSATLDMDNVAAFAPPYAAMSLAYEWFGLAQFETDVGADLIRELGLRQWADPWAAAAALGGYTLMGLFIVVRSLKRQDVLGAEG